MNKEENIRITKIGEFTFIEHNPPDEKRLKKYVKDLQKYFDDKYGKVVEQNEEVEA